MGSTETSTALIRNRPCNVKTPSVSSIEHDGSCWTCITRGSSCDKGLPGPSSAEGMLMDRLSHVQERRVCVRGIRDKAALEQRRWARVEDAVESGDHGQSEGRPSTQSIAESVHMEQPIHGTSYSLTSGALLIWVEKGTSLFAGYIPENPIIAASTTRLERHYLRHFLTYPSFGLSSSYETCLSGSTCYRR